MAKKKKPASKEEISKAFDEPQDGSPDQPQQDSSARDMSEKNAAIKSHSKFDKFKKGEK